MAPLRVLLQALLLMLVLLSASLGQLSSSSSTLIRRKAYANTQQWYFSNDGRGKMQTGGVPPANRRLVRADTNAGSRPISFGAAPGPVNRNPGQAIGFGVNGNTPSSGDRISQPQVPGTTPENKSRPYRTREMPRCANNSRATPCEADDDYNEEIAERVRRILRDSRMNAIIENGAVTDLLQDSALVKDKTFGGPSVRFGPEGDFVSETPACRAQESIIYPQRAKTTADDWVFVINQDTVKQGVRVEKCIREGESCDLGVGQTPTIRTTCRQKFIYRKLLVLSDSGSSVQPESVLIPSCCVCYIRRNDVSQRDFHKSLARNPRPRKQG